MPTPGRAFAEHVTGGMTWSFTFIALVMAGGGIVASLLGRENRGRKLL